MESSFVASGTKHEDLLAKRAGEMCMTCYLRIWIEAHPNLVHTSIGAGGCACGQVGIPASTHSSEIPLP